MGFQKVDEVFFFLSNWLFLLPVRTLKKGRCILKTVRKIEKKIDELYEGFFTTVDTVYILWIIHFSYKSNKIPIKRTDDKSVDTS